MSTTKHNPMTEATANGALSYEQVRDAILTWPISMRAILMHELLDTLTSQEDVQERRRKALSEMLGLLKTDKPALSDEGDEPYGPRRHTLDDALGLAHTDGPAPSDEDVERWLDEHRMEKYG